MPRIEFIPVTPHVLCVRRPRYLSNSYIVHDDRGVVLVDAGMEPDGSDMLRGLEHVHRSRDEIAAILLTHWHNDRSSGAEAIRRETGATVYCHRDEHPHLTKSCVRGARRTLADMLPEHGPAAAIKALVGLSPPHAIESATFVENGQLIAARFRVVCTPGHSLGHLSYVYEPDSVLFAGDALAVSGDRLWFMSRFLTEDRALALESMRTCVAIDAEFICPGHRAPLVERLATGKPWPLLS
jgi:glyoxylase-like metal-dependent hydrolase (beta-lactamase superfamily II)